MSQDRYTKSTAVWGGDKSEYRYSLKREWMGGKGKIIFIMLNPSTADEKLDDPTVRCCMNRAMRDGFGCCEIVNLFAIRGANPKIIKQVDDPVGPDNNKAICGAVRSAKLVICAWGAQGGFDGRGGYILELISGIVEHGNIPVKVFGWTKNGEPKHPLYQRNDNELEDFPIV